MNKKIEQLLDWALSSPAAEDMKIRAKLIEDARELDYLTVNDNETIELVEGLRKGTGNEVNIDVVFELYSKMAIILSEVYMPNIDFEFLLTKFLVDMVKS